jgi:hypothetical protein
MVSAQDKSWQRTHNVVAQALANLVHFAFAPIGHQADCPSPLIPPFPHHPTHHRQPASQVRPPHLRKLQRLLQLALPYQLDQTLLLQVEEQLLLVLQNFRVKVVHPLYCLRAIGVVVRGYCWQPERQVGEQRRQRATAAGGQAGSQPACPRLHASRQAGQQEAKAARQPRACSTSPRCTALRMSMRSVI